MAKRVSRSTVPPIPAEAGRDVPDQAGQVEHGGVVEAEVVGGDEVDAGGLLGKPILAPQGAAGRFEIGEGEFPRPVGFGGFL